MTEEMLRQVQELNKRPLSKEARKLLKDYETSGGLYLLDAAQKAMRLWYERKWQGETPSNERTMEVLYAMMVEPNSETAFLPDLYPNQVYSRMCGTELLYPSEDSSEEAMLELLRQPQMKDRQKLQQLLGMIQTNLNELYDLSGL